jgi:hypothetical protein
MSQPDPAAWRCACGSPDWIAVSPGHAPRKRTSEPETDMVIWCAQCWPWRRDVPADVADA